MLQETLNELFVDVYLKKTSDLDWINKVQSKTLKFILKLIENGIPLGDINVNDWSSSSWPVVYLLDRRYERCSDYDLSLALKYYRKFKGR